MTQRGPARSLGLGSAHRSWPAASCDAAPQPLGADDSALYRGLLAQACVEARIQARIQVWAWCLMPNQLHLIPVPAAGTDGTLPGQAGAMVQHRGCVVGVRPVGAVGSEAS
jgi:hypothetical protein